MNRNDLRPLVNAGIPAVTTDFECGAWGRHEPPTINLKGEIEFPIGIGYRSRRHLHGQNVYVIDVLPEEGQALVEIRKFGDLYGAGLWHYLVGVDDQGTYVKQVPARTQTVHEALESMTPAAVRHAEAKGIEVRHFGDWFFMPTSPQRLHGDATCFYTLSDGHVAEEALVGKTVIYVRGGLGHWRLLPLYLGGWHKAIRDKSIHGGYLARNAPGEERTRKACYLLRHYLISRHLQVVWRVTQAIQETVYSPVIRTMRENICPDCRYTWLALTVASRCPRCHGEKVADRAPNFPESKSPTDLGEIGQELYIACLKAFGGSPWESPPMDAGEIITGLNRPLTNNICLSCRHIWKAPLSPSHCPLCEKGEIISQTIRTTRQKGAG